MGILRSVADKAMGLVGYGRKTVPLPGAEEGVVAVNPDGSVGIQVASEDYLNIQKVHPWVYACVRRITAGAGQVPFNWYRLERDEGEGAPKRVAVPDHKLQKLVDKPNPYMTGIELRKLGFTHLELAGNAFWAIERDEGGEAAELWPLRPDWTRIGVKDGRPLGVMYGNPDKPEAGIPYPWDDVVHLKYFDPANMLYGLSPIQAASRSISSDLYAMKWNTSFLTNSARPDGALMTDQALDKSSLQVLADQWRKAHQGATKAHRVAILYGGLKWQTFGLSQKDMDFIQQRKLAREEICAVYGVPPSLVGLLEYANYSNFREQRQLFWEDTMMDRLQVISEAINLHLLAKADFEDVDGIFGAYDVSGVRALRESEKEMIETAVRAVASGIDTINEVRRRRNQPDVPWGDSWWGNMAQVPLGTVEGKPVPDVLVPTNEDVEKAILWSEERIGEPGWVKSLGGAR